MNRREAAEYIRAMSNELVEIAQDNKLNHLAYLLAMAAEEAGQQAARPEAIEPAKPDELTSA